MSVSHEKTTNETEASGELHIAGIVIYAQYERLDAIRQSIDMLPGAEVHAVSAQGKMVVTLEGRHASEVAGQIDALHVLPGVYSATLVYQHNEDIASLNEEFIDEPDPSRIY